MGRCGAVGDGWREKKIMATRQSKSKKYQVDHSTLTTSEGRDYEYRQVIEKRFKEAADCKRRLGILLMLQAVYHLGTVFIAYGSTLEGFAPAPASHSSHHP